MIDPTGTFNSNFIYDQFQKGKHRGPEHSQKLELGFNIKLGFHRLAINGLNNLSSQPIIINNIALICNGEIYNYKELYQELNIIPTTESDCEIIIHLYNLFGIEKTLQLLDGVFSFVLYDMTINNVDSSKIFIARDPLGIRPLYILKNRNVFNNEFTFIIASELKMLTQFYSLLLEDNKNNNSNDNNDDDDDYKNNNDNNISLTQFKPGTYSLLEKKYTILSPWKETIINSPYFSLVSSFPSTFFLHDENLNNDWIIKGIQQHLYNAVKKRYFNSERPIACLLSGGLDSSLITAIICQIHKEINTDSDKFTPIETYSIGLPNSEDLKYARIVASHLNTNHHEIIVSEKEMIDIIPEVIENIESYDTTTVRASIGNYLIGKYISKHSNAKVIFNGDGSDELCGGYLYMSKAPNVIEFDIESRRLLTDIHLFDVLRSDKCISSNGLEPRTPFLDKNFVNFYLSIPAKLRMNTIIEKYLLRTSFSEEKYGIKLLPHSILWRKKEAFSDGVCQNNRSLYTIIQEYTDTLFNNDVDSTSEQKYYKSLFNNYFPNLSNIVPYFWMPKYIHATDPSARTLSIYNKSSNEDQI
jgi:asparagine synthase (glutamine-hydrolysing)